MNKQKFHLTYFVGVIFSLFIFNSTEIYAQCAGTDNTVTVCDKDLDTGNKTYSLFAQLAGSPTSGGTWSTTNPANFVALNANSGIVNLWRINNFGIHIFTYTNDCSGAIETATVTINLGGYAGENNIDGSANACGNDNAVNLHGFLGSDIDEKVQDFNGLWEEDPTTFTGFLNENIFDALEAGPGVYIFTYTVEAVASCPSKQSTVILEVHPPPNPGLPTTFEVCTNEDLSGFRNLNLNNYLVSEDDNGTWSETGTNQISDLSDIIIDVEQINANFGYGTYSFIYTVFPTHPICEEETSQVDIVILPALEGSLNTTNFCSGLDYIVNLSYNQTILPNGGYDIQYRITSSNGQRLAIDETAVLNNGNGFFTVSPTFVIPNEFVTVEIVGISRRGLLGGVCSNTDVIQTTFLVSDASATTSNICLDTDAVITLTNILDAGGSLSSVTHDVVYTVTDSNNNISTYTASNIPFSNGLGSFDIPFANLPGAGDYSVAIDIPDAFDLDCLGTSFTITPYPEDIALDLVVDNSCDATRIDVIVDAPILADGGYTITYDVTDNETSTILVDNTITFTGGTANYAIDITTLPQGNYSVVLRSVQDDTTLCRAIFEFELEEEFSIGGIPDAPIAATNQSFCTVDFDATSPNLSNIEVTATGIISFYDAETDITALPLSTLLVDGEDYFISNTDPNNSCENSEKTQVTISLNTPANATTTDTNPIFCAIDSATVTSLDVNAPNGGVVLWYDAATNGNLINETEILIDNKSYFAAEQIGTGCESPSRLEIIPTIVAPSSVSLEFLNIAMCSLKQPTVSSLQDLVLNTEIEVDWYDSPTADTPLLLTDLLIDKTIYYAESYDEIIGCINPERIAVTVDLGNCNPEDYDFFVPDGFSPNADNKNDIFFIPNIAEIFPDFTIEIFNRYGNVLFKGDKNNPSWDGQNNQSGAGNTIAPNGVYFYVLNYNREGFDKKQGRLYLNR